METQRSFKNKIPEMKPVADASKYLNFNSNVAYQWRAISHRIFTFFLVSLHWDNKEKAIGGKRKNNSKTASRFETLADSRLETKELGSCLTEILAYAGASRLLFYFTFFLLRCIHVISFLWCITMRRPIKRQ